MADSFAKGSGFVEEELQEERLPKKPSNQHGLEGAEGRKTVDRWPDQSGISFKV